MTLSTYTSQALLNSLFKKTSALGALASAPTTYVALSSTLPTEAGTNITEPSTGSYARVSTAAGDWVAATNADPSVVSNGNAITFPTASGDWLSAASIPYFFLVDASSSGNVLAIGTLAVPKTVLNGDTPSFAVGGLTVTLT